MDTKIDRDLAEKVMGWKCKGPMFDGFCFMRDEEKFDGLLVGDVRHAYTSWSPSTSRDDAHEVLSKLTDEQWRDFGMLVRRQIRESGDYIQMRRSLMRRSLTRGLLMLTPAQISEAVWSATC